MTTFEPEALKHYRLRKSLTQAELASKARVDKQTVYRLESGRIKAPRKRVLELIAKALDIKLEALGQRPAIAEFPDMLDSYRSDMSVKVSGQARNAYTLTAMRYGVSKAAIAEIAPFLFTWASEASLRRRSSRLDDVKAALSNLETLAPNFPHLSRIMTSHWRAEEIAQWEEKSISRRDIFGTSIPFEDGDIASGTADEDTDNPFTIFLKDLEIDLGDAGHFLSWNGRGSPDYIVGEEQAESLFSGSAKAIDAVMIGAAKLDQMPKKLTQAERISWALEQVAAADAQLRREHPELADFLDGIEAFVGDAQ